MIGRRCLALGVAAMAAGCGFQPVYGVNRPSKPALAAVYVNIIPNRAGQLLRQALQAQLEGTSGDVAKRYTLSVSYAEAIEGQDVQADNSTTRNRDIGTAIWSLRGADTPLVPLAGGTVRSVDGYNIIDQQFFYQDLEEDATQRRLAEALANQIVLAMGVFFDKHPG